MCRRRSTVHYPIPCVQNNDAPPPRRSQLRAPRKRSLHRAALRELSGGPVASSCDVRLWQPVRR